MHNLSIIVPCYNESGNIILIINKFIEAIGDRKNIEVIFVNNGSTDNSSIVFESELSAIRNERFKAIFVPVNEGYGHGILKGLEQATGDVLAWTHADMQTDPADVIRGFEIFEKKSNPNIFIKGRRKQRKPLETFFTFGMGIIAFFALNTYLEDINAQPKIFSRDFFTKHVENLAPKDFSLDLFVLYKAKKLHYEIVEIPVFFGKRHAGLAKGGGSWKTRIKLINRTLNYIFELRKSLLNYMSAN
jgi:glycosyltransferase involved in cell wall biosynthesis